MIEPGRDAGREFGLDAKDFFRDGFQALEVSGGVFAAGFVVGDDREAFAQSVGKGPVGIVCLHAHQNASAKGNCHAVNRAKTRGGRFAVPE